MLQKQNGHLLLSVRDSQKECKNKHVLKRPGQNVTENVSKAPCWKLKMLL